MTAAANIPPPRTCESARLCVLALHVSCRTCPKAGLQRESDRQPEAVEQRQRSREVASALAGRGGAPRDSLVPRAEEGLPRAAAPSMPRASARCDFLARNCWWLSGLPGRDCAHSRRAAAAVWHPATVLPTLGSERLNAARAPLIECRRSPTSVFAGDMRSSQPTVLILCCLPTGVMLLPPSRTSSAARSASQPRSVGGMHATQL